MRRSNNIQVFWPLHFFAQNQLEQALNDKKRSIDYTLRGNSKFRDSAWWIYIYFTEGIITISGLEGLIILLNVHSAYSC